MRNKELRLIEFAALIGASYSTVHAWAKKGYIKSYAPRCHTLRVRYEEAVRTTIVAEFLERNDKPLPPGLRPAPVSEPIYSFTR